MSLYVFATSTVMERALPTSFIALGHQGRSSRRRATVMTIDSCNLEISNVSAHECTTSQRGAAAVPSFQIDPPAYWFPEHYVPSAWLQHAPFAFWLVDALRPRSIVELGTHNGFSFFVFAEAVRRLGLACTVDAVDSWQGDDHAGFYGEEVYSSVSKIALEDYPGFTRLHRVFFDVAVSDFPDGSIDLLHIDGRHGYDDVKTDFETYVPKLSERAVVIFHDTHEFHEGFEVHRFWDEIAATRPSFNFHHGHGLGVLAFGTEAPSPILKFLSYAGDHDAVVRDAYQGLGEEVERIHADRVDLERLSGVEQQLLDARNDLAHLRGSASWRVTAPLRRIRSLLPR